MIKNDTQTVLADKNVYRGKSTFFVKIKSGGTLEAKEVTTKPQAKECLPERSKHIISRGMRAIQKVCSISNALPYTTLLTTPFLSELKVQLSSCSPRGILSVCRISFRQPIKSFGTYTAKSRSNGTKILRKKAHSMMQKILLFLQQIRFKGCAL
ncbi:MAG: hypothetical protein LBF13_00605 [Campylobacteraceae bacterium]|jgi:hypothetical protein|nr:hypothetical protein [Campylobacteraceae bacterium]